MAIKAKPFTWRAQGVSDARDASSVFEGAMAALTNLIFAPEQAALMTCRPAAVQLSDFSGFTTPGVPTALLVVGDYAWGFVPSGRYAGKDEPFCYDILNGVFITLANVTAANCPTSQATTGDWTPPTMAMISAGRIAITHPGYDAISNFLGWIDISQASLTGLTGTTHTSTLIDTLSANPILAGWQVGMQIAGAGIPAGTYIVSMTAASVTLSQATVASAGAVALTVTGGSQAAPLYGAGNFNANPIVGSVATCVAQFNSRAYWGWKNYVVYSDTLNPMQITNATQAFQIGDNVPINALAGLPLTSQINGGTLQSLIVFKGAGAVTQITGDPATGNLAINAVNGSVGTLAPNSICATPRGLCYVAPDGVRVLGLDGVVQPPIGTHGEGIARPFANAVYPSRVCAAFNDQVLRVSTQNGLLPGAPMQEWWFHWDLERWTGPHTSACALVRPYFGTQVGPFVHVLSGVGAKLFASGAEPNVASTYTENGVELTWTWTSLLTPDNGQLAMNNLAPQSTISAALPPSQTVNVLLSDETGAAIDNYLITQPASVGAVWGAFNWGALTWGLAALPLQQVAINWSKPEVFKQAQVQLNGASAPLLLVGDLRAGLQTLGYVIP